MIDLSWSTHFESSDMLLTLDLSSSTADAGARVHALCYHGRGRPDTSVFT
jgi:hypothetical protein